ncbi:nitroreductase family protein [Roseimarinus sediminis]|uniref:nitroreductase family protein n=1 Tax=Roseimarinus sediminis TaxID=1610899 RepID=UPI003D1C413F
MEFSELVKQRYAVRDFSPRKVEEAAIEKLLDTARKAPSAVNFQPYRIYLVESDSKLDAVKSCYHRNWIKSAPLIFVVVGLHKMGWKRAVDSKDHTDIDAALFIDHLMLQAAEMGLGTCWVCNFDLEALSQVLQLADDEIPVAMVPVGYPTSSDIPVKMRKGIDELVLRI